MLLCTGAILKIQFVGFSGVRVLLAHLIKLTKGIVKFSMKTLRYVGHGPAKRALNAVALKEQEAKHGNSI